MIEERADVHCRTRATVAVGRGSLAVTVERMRTIEFAGTQVPVLGQGTWHMGDAPQRRAEELAALRLGIDLGMTLVDTAELYGSGRSEELVGEAISGRRDEVFLVSKVMPSNASRDGTIRACERSLRRLGTDRLDLYLLHWRGSHPVDETVAAFEELASAGKIRAWGVSNFDRDAMASLSTRPGVAPGLPEGPATDQILLNLRKRWAETGLLDDLRARAIPVMAYSPIEEGVLARTGTGEDALGRVAARHDATRVQAAIAWVIAHPDVVAIPKASSKAHVRDNAAAAAIELSVEDLADLDEAFPRPEPGARLELH